MESEIFAALREIFVLLMGERVTALRPFHLTPQQFDTLLLLQADAGWRMGDLSSHLLLDNSMMTRIVDHMADMGWAERRPDPDDRRAQQVFLTTAGAAQREAAQVAHVAALQDSLAELDGNEQTQLLALLSSWQGWLNVNHKK